MKITYVKLVNVSSIQTGSNVNELEIDLSNSRNRIILIGGPNGCGKTSLLSCLHPFAYNGTLDDRSSEPLIVPGKEGYKEIHIKNGQDEFIIKHYYSPNGQTHSVKSYIMKNGIELNSNGNVTSFKEIVSLELDLEMDFLKLIRLGSNVVNFMDLKPTERKNYMGNLLDEADIYLQFHKKIVSDMRIMKGIIARDTDKLSKLNITDIDHEEEYLRELREHVLAELQDELQKLKSEQSIILYELRNHGSLSEIADHLNQLAIDANDIKKTLESKKYAIVDVSRSSDEITSELIKAKGMLESFNAKRVMLIHDIDDLEQELNDLRIQKEKLDNDEERQSYMNIIQSLEVEITELKNHFRDFKPTYTSEDIKELLDILNKAQTILSSTYEIGDKPIKDVIRCLRENVDFELTMDAGYGNILNNKSKDACEFVKKFIINRIDFSGTKCSEECPYRELYDSITHHANLEHEQCESAQHYGYMEMAYKNIQTALKLITDNGDLFKRMPTVIQEMFTFKCLYKHIEKREWIYDLKAINEQLTIIKEYEHFLSKKESLKETRDKLDRLGDSSGLAYIEDRIETVLNKISTNKGLIKELVARISDISDKVSALEDAVSIRKRKEELGKQLEDARKEYLELKEEHDMVADWKVKLDKINAQILRYEEAIRRRTDDVKLLERRIDEYHILTKDLKKVKEDYDDWEITRSTLSGKEGIPLIHIDLYLKKTRKIVNELLDIIYDGSLRIDKFDISADTFRIPYTKNGKTISDAKLASQGESSFITIALSFALSLQSIRKYNIMLLDEIDSTLDATNREKFITILERMMDMVDTEQIFLISHNNMFDMYPVDYLDMGNVMKDETLVPRAIH